jgi:hypothetical protein
MCRAFLARKRAERQRRIMGEHPPVTTQDAVASIHSTRLELARVQGMWTRVNNVSGTLNREREMNHFADRIRAALEGK